MFLASIGKPYIGLHQEIHWDVAMYALDVPTEDRARAVVRKICGEKDYDVARALLKIGREDDEYFDVSLHQVPLTRRSVRIPIPNSGLPDPNISYRI